MPAKLPRPKRIYERGRAYRCGKYEIWREPLTGFGDTKEVAVNDLERNDLYGKVRIHETAKIGRIGQ